MRELREEMGGLGQISLGYWGEEDDDEDDESNLSEEEKLLEALAGLKDWREDTPAGKRNPYIEQLKRASKEYREAIEKMLELGVRRADVSGGIKR